MNVLVRLCKEDPLSVHCYAVYYLTREPDRTEIVLIALSGNIGSYALVWYGGRSAIMDIYEIHIWKPIREVVLGIDVAPDKKQTYSYRAAPPKM
ncbi:MAG: hypothetical protein QXF10_09465 [Ignisphaera sp.]